MLSVYGIPPLFPSISSFPASLPHVPSHHTDASDPANITLITHRTYPTITPDHERRQVEDGVGVALEQGLLCLLEFDGLLSGVRCVDIFDASFDAFIPVTPHSSFSSFYMHHLFISSAPHLLVSSQHESHTEFAVLRDKMKTITIVDRTLTVEYLSKGGAFRSLFHLPSNLRQSIGRRLFTLSTTTTSSSSLSPPLPLPLPPRANVLTDIDRWVHSHSHLIPPLPSINVPKSWKPTGFHR